jgi:hypothetical protein
VSRGPREEGSRPRPAGAPGRRSRKPSWRRVMLPALLVLLLMLFVALAAGCGSSSDTPGKAIENMVRATYDGDCDVIISSMSQEFIDEVGGDRQLWRDSCNEQQAEAPADRPTLVSFEVTDETIDGDHAKVSFTVTEDVAGQQQTSSRTMELVREDDQWKYTVTPKAPSVETSTTAVETSTTAVGTVSAPVTVSGQ